MWNDFTIEDIDPSSERVQWWEQWLRFVVLGFSAVPGRLLPNVLKNGGSTLAWRFWTPTTGYPLSTNLDILVELVVLSFLQTQAQLAPALAWGCDWPLQLMKPAWLSKTKRFAPLIQLKEMICVHSKLWFQTELCRVATSGTGFSSAQTWTLSVWSVLLQMLQANLHPLPL